jgi:hypothetical protein
MLVDLDIQHAMLLRHILVSDRAGCTIFYHVISHMERFKKYIEHKMQNVKSVLIFSITFVRNISHSKKHRARYDKNVD